MKRLLQIGLPLLILLALAYVGVSWYFASQVIVFQSVPIVESVAASPNEAADPDYNNLDRWIVPFDAPLEETFEIEVNGVTLVGDYYSNDSDAECAVVFVHGLSGSRKRIGWYGPFFYDLGCDVVAYDARAHGDSSDGFLTYGYYERHEVAAMVDWVAQRSNLDTSQVGLVGASYGAAALLQSLAVQPNVAFTIADSSYESMQRIVTEQAVNIFGAPIRVIVPGAFAVAQFRADFDLAEVAIPPIVAEVDTPILLLHSSDDSYTLPSHSEAIFAAANPATTKLVLLDYGSVHAESILDNPDGVREEVYAFIAEYAPSFGQPLGVAGR